MKDQYPYLKRWTRPHYYMGAEWPDYYRAGVGQSRDSQPLERANFAAMLKALGGECSHPVIEDPNDEGAALSLVRVIRESHWAVGWIEWIAIHESQAETLATANSIMERLEDYPVIDDELFSQYENEEYCESWDFWGRSDYIKEIKARLFQEYPNGVSEDCTDDEIDDAVSELTTEEIDSLRDAAAQKVNWEYQSEDSGVSINIKGLVDKTDFDKLADLAIDYVLSTRKANDIRKLAAILGADDKVKAQAVAQGLVFVSQIKKLIPPA